MASLRQIRRRMKSIENIHEITKAMEMIAGFRLKRTESRFSRSKLYFSEWERLASNLAVSVSDRLDDPRHQNAGGQALFERRKIEKKALVVLTADKGLCGAYNAGLLKAASTWLGENAGFGAALVPIGKVGCDTFRKKSMPVLAAYPEKSRADFAMAAAVTGELKKLFLERRVDSVEILYASFRAGGAGQIRIVPFLSLARLFEEKPDRAAVEYIFEPDFRSVFSSVVSRFLQSQIYGILLESLTSEYSARMIAMKQASDNGEEVLDDLKILRNKTRQAVITRELSEIVSGASVLV